MKEVAVKQNKLFLICKYVLFFSLLFLLSKAKVNNLIYPFSFGLYFALIWCNQNILVLSPLYIIANFIPDFNLYSLYSAVFTCFLMLAIYGIHIKLKKRILPLMMLPYACICQIGSVFFNIYAGNEWFIVFIELVFGLLYMFCCMKIFESIISVGITKRLTVSQIICAGAVILSFGTALGSLYFYGFDFAKLFIIFCIIFTTIILPIKESGFVCFVLTLGTVLVDNNAYLLAPMGIAWLVASCFRGRHRIFIVLSVAICEVMSVYYFNFYYFSGYEIFIPSAIGIILAFAIPTKYYKKMAEIYNSSFQSRSLQSIINRNRENVRKRLNKLSQVFLEMNVAFKEMIKGNVSEQEIRALLLTEIKGSLCVDCPEKNRCFRIYGDETNSILSALVDIAFEKGRITLIDIPSVLAARCNRINQLVYSANNLIEQYQNYASLVANIDNSKMLVSEQFFGVGNVLKQLATDVGKLVNFDNGLEKEIIDELLYNDIVCSDAVVYHDNNNVVSCTLEVKKEDSLKSKISQIVSKVCKTKMYIESDESSQHAGWQILNIKTAPKYDVVFGTSAITKSSSTKSGDCYAIMRLEDGKILMALCDGMGSGEKAQRTSTTAMSLVENFYKAGFESEIILDSVNKFLSLGGQDIFSCLDMSIIDLNNGNVDFIKLGATNGFIKHNDLTTTIECSALPLGIIKNITPTIKSTMLCSGDMVIICTDGVSDSFASDEEMTDFVNNISSVNPQEVADILMDKAFENNKNIAMDDMTILVAKIF